MNNTRRPQFDVSQNHYLRGSKTFCMFKSKHYKVPVDLSTEESEGVEETHRLEKSWLVVDMTLVLAIISVSGLLLVVVFDLDSFGVDQLATTVTEAITMNNEHLTFCIRLIVGRSSIVEGYTPLAGESNLISAVQLKLFFEQAYYREHREKRR
ncbi:hypothetical protein EV360DRAFT_65574 [Lentinula raphanica]|nr:hypothetical protein EV360DRAFT_65574 [Lentinula raphanica]